MRYDGKVAIVTGASTGIGELRQGRCARLGSACSAPAGGPSLRASTHKRTRPGCYEDGRQSRGCCREADRSGDRDIAAPAIYVRQGCRPGEHPPSFCSRKDVRQESAQPDAATGIAAKFVRSRRVAVASERLPRPRASLELIKCLRTGICGTAGIEFRTFTRIDAPEVSK